MRIDNLLHSGHTFSEDEYYLKLRYSLFNALLLFNIVFVLLAMLVRLLSHQYINAFIDLCYILPAIVTFLLARRHKNTIETLVYFLLFFSYLVITAIFYYHTNKLAGISWYVVLVIVGVIFKGRKDALIVFAFSVLTIMVIALYRYHYPLRDVLIGLLPFFTTFFIVIVFDRLHTGMRTLIESQKEKYIHLSRYDALTDIPNRTVFFEHLESELRHSEETGEPFALLFVDLNNFKTINDRYGHQVGDAVLAAVSKRLKMTLRKNDLLARYGGDEFALILPAFKSRQHLKQILNRLLETINEPVNVDGELIRVTLSAGVALSPRNATDKFHLLKYADEAMYAAKRIKSNAFCFYEDIKNNLTA